MNYYWFNRKELLRKSWNKYHYNGKTANYYAANAEVLRENARNTYRKKKEKNGKREYQRPRYHNTDLSEGRKQYHIDYYNSKIENKIKC